MLPAKEDMTTIQIFSNLGNNRTAKVRFLFEKQNSYNQKIPVKDLPAWAQDFDAY